MNIAAIRSINLDRVLEIEEAVGLSAEIRLLESEYDFLELPIPEWLTKSADVLREEIARRTRASDLAALKKLESEIESYRSVSERKTDAQRRLAELQKKLGIGKASR
jgi:hypothetical protein